MKVEICVNGKEDKVQKFKIKDVDDLTKILELAKADLLRIGMLKELDIKKHKLKFKIDGAKYDTEEVASTIESYLKKNKKSDKKSDKNEKESKKDKKKGSKKKKKKGKKEKKAKKKSKSMCDEVNDVISGSTTIGKSSLADLFEEDE